MRVPRLVPLVVLVPLGLLVRLVRLVPPMWLALLVWLGPPVVLVLLACRVFPGPLALRCPWRPRRGLLHPLRSLPRRGVVPRQSLPLQSQARRWLVLLLLL